MADQPAPVRRYEDVDELVAIVRGFYQGEDAPELVNEEGIPWRMQDGTPVALVPAMFELLVESTALLAEIRNNTGGGFDIQSAADRVTIELEQSLDLPDDQHVEFDTTPMVRRPLAELELPYLRARIEVATEALGWLDPGRTKIVAEAVEKSVRRYVNEELNRVQGGGK